MSSKDKGYSNDQDKNDDYKEYEPRDLSVYGFKVHELEGLERDNVVNAFAGYVDEVLGKINDGKEATVYLCRAKEAHGEHRFLAAKMFRPRKFRNFDNDRAYRNFGKMRDKRMAKAMRDKSKKGQAAFHKHWVDSEWQFLNELHAAGVSVPKAYAIGADGILMEYIGNREGPAPRLVNCRLSDNEALDLFDAILADITRMIEHDIVHGDFSAYNILYDGKRHIVIDVPQAVDARTTPDAYSLFQRDLTNIGKYFDKYGLTVPIHDLMRRYF